MSEEGGIFIFGIVVGAFIIGLIMLGISNGELNNCAKEHNIYECEWVTVPMEPNP